MKRDPVVIIVVAMVISLMLVLGLHLSRRGSEPSPAGKLQGHGRISGVDRAGVHVWLAALQLHEDLVGPGIAFRG